MLIETNQTTFFLMKVFLIYSIGNLLHCSWSLMLYFSFFILIFKPLLASDTGQPHSWEQFPPIRIRSFNMYFVRKSGFRLSFAYLINLVNLKTLLSPNSNSTWILNCSKVNSQFYTICWFLKGKKKRFSNFSSVVSKDNWQFNAIIYI